MQWLPTTTVGRLDDLVGQLHGHGCRAARADVVCAVLISCDPARPRLLEDLRAYRARFTPPARPARHRENAQPVMLSLPSPISLRVDGIVATIRQHEARIYRHEVIGTLIMAAPDDARRLEGQCEKYWTATARDAAVPGQPLRRVLTQQKPLPGARAYALH